MDPDLTIVLLGNTGVGKSASGNTILGRSAFESELSSTPVTTHISTQTGPVFGKRISVIDTPDIFGSEREIQTCVLQSSRPRLVLVVFSLGPFTKEQAKVVKAVESVLGPQGLSKCHLVFTHGDAIQDRSLEDFIFGGEASSSYHAAFSGRCHLFDNKNGDEEQVRELLMKTGHLGTQQLPDSPADVSKDRKVVLLGRPGEGKSSSGNTILGSKQFQSAGGFDPVTAETVSGSATVGGCQVTVVDTPGITDKDLTLNQLYYEIMKSVVEASPGPHAFVIVVRLGKITEGDIKVFELLEQLFSRDAHKYSMVLFTHGDELGGRSIDGLIRSNQHVSDLVSMCGGRYCVFDNKAKRSREQVRDFLSKVDQIVSDNGGEHYTDDMFRMAHTFLKEETLLNKHRNLSGDAGQPKRSAWERFKRFIHEHKRRRVWVVLDAILEGAVRGGLGVLGIATGVGTVLRRVGRGLGGGGGEGGVEEGGGGEEGGVAAVVEGGGGRLGGGGAAAVVGGGGEGEEGGGR